MLGWICQELSVDKIKTKLYICFVLTNQGFAYVKKEDRNV